MGSNPRNFRLAVPALVGPDICLGGTTATIILKDADAGATDDYNQMLVVITTAGTGPPVGQRGLITKFTNDGAGAHTAQIICLDTADGKWSAAPQSGVTQYAIMSLLRDQPFVRLAQAGGGARSIILADGESNKDGFYRGLDVELVDGTGAHLGQKHPIIKYTGSSRTAEVVGPFDANPDATTRYRIPGHLYSPVGRLFAQDTGGTLKMRTSTRPSGVALATYSTGAGIDEENASDMSYLEIAGDAGAITLEMYRTEK